MLGEPLPGVPFLDDHVALAAIRAVLMRNDYGDDPWSAIEDIADILDGAGAE